MWLDWERHRREYFYDGLTVLPGIVPLEIVERWRDQALAAAEICGINRDFDANDVDVLGDGGHYKYVVIDGFGVRRHLSSMVDWYKALVPLVAAVTLQDVLTSPHGGRSDVNVLVYRGAGSQQSWHYDTNPITVLLYLTSNQDGGTECELFTHNPAVPGKRLHTVRPQAGSILLMQGRKVWHRSAPVLHETKITCPWNYYTVDDTWRPEGIDELVYGSPGVIAEPEPIELCERAIQL